jgi:hypothetical protein
MRTLTCGVKAGQALCGFRSRPSRKGDHQPETATIEWPLQGEKPGDLPPFGLGRRLAGVSGSHLDVRFAELGLLLRPIAAYLVLTPMEKICIAGYSAQQRPRLLRQDGIRHRRPGKRA